MRESLLQRCDLFCDNYETVKDVAGWENSIMVKLSAYVFASQNMQVDRNRFKECKQLIKNSAGLLSNFRGITKLYTISTLAMADRPEEKMELLKMAYDCLKNEFRSSDYMVAAAGILVDFVEPSMYPEIAERAKSIYNMLKDEHPILTGREDITFTVLFALSEKSDSVLLQETEACFKELKKHFFSKNDVQALSFVLALGDGNAAYKCQRTMELYEELIQNGCRFGRGNELASLGVLALADGEISELASEIAQVNSYLKSKRGFGNFGTPSRQRLMFAGMLVMNEYVEKDTSGQDAMKVTALNGVISIIIAQQAATCAAIAAAAASSSASS